MKILVTGANGFIGRRLSARLIAQGHHVSGLSLTRPPSNDLKFQDYYQQDLSKPFSLNRSFDLVIHLAAYNITNVGFKDTDLYTAINVQGTKNLLQAVETKKFVYLSTTKVYVNQGKPLTEESPISPQGAYEQSKLKAEELCRSFLNMESLVILRSVNVIGWGQAPKAVLPVFFHKARANQPLDIINPSYSMQFIYVEDLIDAVEAVNDKPISGIFNIANEEIISLEELARRIIALMRSSSVLNIIKNSSEILFSKVNSDKANKSFGWKAQTGLTEILELYEREYAKQI